MERYFQSGGWACKVGLGRLQKYRQYGEIFGGWVLAVMGFISNIYIYQENVVHARYLGAGQLP